MHAMKTTQSQSGQSVHATTKPEARKTDYDTAMATITLTILYTLIATATLITLTM
jgi:hypothetical protein